MTLLGKFTKSLLGRPVTLNANGSSSWEPTFSGKAHAIVNPASIQVLRSQSTPTLTLPAGSRTSALSDCTTFIIPHDLDTIMRLDLDRTSEIHRVENISNCRQCVVLLEGR